MDNNNPSHIKRIKLEKNRKSAGSLLSAFIRLYKVDTNHNMKDIEIVNFVLKADRSFKSKNASTTLSFNWWKEYLELNDLKTLFKNRETDIRTAVLFLSGTKYAKDLLLQKSN